MQFPLSLLDINLFLSAMVIILLITSELVSPTYWRKQLVFNKKKLRKVAFIVGGLYIITLLIRMYQMTIA